MEIQKYINEYVDWLKSEITFQKVGEYYEINTPFLDDANDYIQFYVKQVKDRVYFTDDGATLHTLDMAGVSLSKNRKEQLNSIIHQYNVHLHDKELVCETVSKDFAKTKHSFIQCILKVNDLCLTSRSRVISFFTDDVQDFFDMNDIRYLPDIQLTGKSGYSHKYDFAIPKSREKSERLCLAINNPVKTQVESVLFSWQDTKASRKNDSELIVLLNDKKQISKNVEDAFSNYEINTIKWSEREKASNMNLLTA